MSRLLPIGVLACFQLCLFAPSASAQFPNVKVRVKYICPSERPSWNSSNGGEKHYCWEGKHYSKSTGGVPQFILDYWAEEERKSAEFTEELRRNSEEMKARAAALGLPSSEEARRTAQERHRAAMERVGARSGGSSASSWTSGRVTTVEQSQKPVNEPLPLNLFSGLDPGATRADVIGKLGQPHGSIANLGSSGDEESMTYLTENRGNATIRLKQGKLLRIQLPEP